MKPFDLKKALAGEPVVTRDGHPVSQLVLFDVDYGWPLHGVIGISIYEWTKEGTSFQEVRGVPPREHYNDLFMAHVKQTRWVNFYTHTVSTHYPTKEDADTAAQYAVRRFGRAYPIEVEE